MKARPQAGEFAPFYQTYVGKVPEGDVVQILQDLKAPTLEFLQQLSPEQWLHRYAADKWSIKEVLVHLLDTERIFAYRALCIARKDQTPFPGFDQDAYVPASKSDERSIDSLLGEYVAVRDATIHLFSNFAADMWAHVGTASGVSVSVRALAYITAGHEIHHVQIVKERYL